MVFYFMEVAILVNYVLFIYLFSYLQKNALLNIFIKHYLIFDILGIEYTEHCFHICNPVIQLYLKSVCLLA